ncbi:hypothetical protein EYR40_010470 [Pleurotus pulmonarius]|nr:hypothetical protein EYR40_010470 [Pleurotus pulmonarius]
MTNAGSRAIIVVSAHTIVISFVQIDVLHSIQQLIRDAALVTIKNSLHGESIILPSARRQGSAIAVPRQIIVGLIQSHMQLVSVPSDEIERRILKPILINVNILKVVHEVYDLCVDDHLDIHGPSSPRAPTSISNLKSSISLFNQDVLASALAHCSTSSGNASAIPIDGEARVSLSSKESISTIPTDNDSKG